MVVPEIDVDSILRRSLVPPQISGSKAHRVDVLWVLTEEMGVRVRKDEHPMIPFDRPVVRLVDVAGATPAQRTLRERWESGLP